MIRRWIKKYKEYPFKLVDKEGKETTIEVNEDLTERLEKVEEITQKVGFLELAYGIKIEFDWKEDIDAILKGIEIIEEEYKNE